MQNSGVPWEDRAHFEDDHFAPLYLGGSDSINNRWAQPRNGEAQLKEAQGWFNTRITPAWRVPYCQIFDDPDCAKIVTQ